MSPESPRRAEPRVRAGTRRGRSPRRSGSTRKTFTATLAALEQLAASGAQVSVRVDDLDRGTTVIAGDDDVTLPVAGVGVVPVLVEAAAAFEAGTLDPFEIVEREGVAAVQGPGLWRHLKAPALPLVDLAVLAAGAGDVAAANALLERVGLGAVRARIDQLGMPRTAVLDRYRDRRGPDDAPHLALSSTRDLVTLFAAIANSRAVSPAVSAQVSEWLAAQHDLTMVASAAGFELTGDDDPHGLMLVNKTGRAAGIRAEAGVFADPRAGVAYALVVGFDDLSIVHRVRVHDAFRVLGVELLEYVY